MVDWKEIYNEQFASCFAMRRYAPLDAWLCGSAGRGGKGGEHGAGSGTARLEVGRLRGGRASTRRRIGRVTDGRAQMTPLAPQHDSEPNLPTRSQLQSDVFALESDKSGLGAAAKRNSRIRGAENARIVAVEQEFRLRERRATGVSPTQLQREKLA